jgi:predicted membrane-bound spermidine synthase
LIRASIIAFVASFCTLVIELVAGRVLAPYVGVSLYTWTSIIGVVLAGISGGAWAGGWLADRRPRASTLAWLLLASGVAAMLIVPSTSILAADEGVLTNLGIATTLLQRVVVLSFLLFFVPAFLLGMISPVAVKLAVRELETAGSVVGRIYAISTLGSIAGTFVTGFWLVARFGTRATLIGVGVVLIATALLAGLFGRVGRAAGALVIAFALAYALLGPGALPPPEQEALLEPRASGIVHSEESQYYTIRVERTIRPDTGGAMHALHLDHLVHSYADLDDPEHLEYGYLRIFNDVAGAAMERAERPRYLFVGGGGYTLPRLLARYHADVEVVEIDPAVTRVARRFFGVSRQLPIRTFNEDARAFAMREHAPYDVIFIDAFNDLSVPYHLTTREYTASLARMLRPGGAIVANLVDDYQHGRFLMSYVKTLESVFGAGNVAIVLEEEEDMRSSRSTFVVVASRTPQQYPDWFVLPQRDLRNALARPGAIVLTDDYAPVDNMLAPLFRERFVDELEGE